MTAYALRLENATDTAARVRLGDLLGLTPADALTARTGIRPAPTAGDVAVDDGTMNVTVQPFVAWVQGGISAAQGGYPFVLDAEATLAVANGDATLDRIDTVAVVIHEDAYDGSGLLDADVVVLQGTPGGSAPALPDNCLPLYDVEVPAGASVGTGGLTSANLGADRRTYTSGLGGVVTVATQAERDALPATKGTVVYRTDTDVLEVRHASGWVEYVQNDTAMASTTSLSAGWTGTIFWQRRSGVVTVFVEAQKASWALFEAITATGVVPAGFRPARNINTNGTNATGDATSRGFSITSGGQVLALAAGTVSVFGYATYLAA